MQKKLFAMLALTLVAGLMASPAAQAADEVKQLTKEQLESLKPNVETGNADESIKMSSSISVVPPAPAEGKVKFRILATVLRTKKAASGRTMTKQELAGTATFYLLDAEGKVAAAKTVPLEQFCAT